MCQNSIRAHEREIAAQTRSLMTRQLVEERPRRGGGSKCKGEQSAETTTCGIFCLFDATTLVILARFPLRIKNLLDDGGRRASGNRTRTEVIANNFCVGVYFFNALLKVARVPFQKKCIFIKIEVFIRS